MAGAEGVWRQTLELNPLLLGMQKLGVPWAFDCEGPGQMAQNVGVQSGGPRWAHRTDGWS